MKPMQLNQNRTLSLSSCEQMLLSFTCLFYSKFVCFVIFLKKLFKVSNSGNKAQGCCLSELFAQGAD